MTTNATEPTQEEEQKKEGEEQHGLEGNTTYIGIPAVEATKNGLFALGNFCLPVAGICRNCFSPVPRGYAHEITEEERRSKWKGKENEKQEEEGIDEGVKMHQPCESHAEWTKSFVQSRQTSEVSLPKTEDEYRHSVFTAEDESTQRLYAEMKALQEDRAPSGPNSPRIISDAVEKAVKR